MANFHSSCKTVSRSAGRSATGAAAYRAGEKIECQRTGEIHDYSRKRGVESATLFLPVGAPELNRAELWNAAEKAETRKNSTVAREWEIALPSELSTEQQKELAHNFTKALVKEFGFAADCAIHKPGKGGDSRNHHAHILCTTRKLTPDGFGEKTRVLDDHSTGAKQIVVMREVLADLTNQTLEKYGFAERVDHRSLAAQGIDRTPGVHLGPTATAIERRGEVSQKTENHQERQLEVSQKAQAAAQLAAEQAQREAAAAAALTASIARLAAQAAHDLETAEKAKQEKKDDGIRAAALAAIDLNVRATSTAWAGTADTIEASRGHLNTGGRVAHSHGRNLGRAIQGAQQRIARSHIESSAPAIGKQLGNVGRVLQQLADRLPNIVRSITAATKAVVRQVAKRLAKAPEQPPQAAQTVAKAVPALALEKPPGAVLDPALTDADRKLISRLDDFIDRAAKGDQKAMDSLAGAFDKLDDARYAAQSDYGRAKPKGFHWPYAEQAAKAQREEAAKLDVNAAAAARGVTAVPYPPGTSGQWAAEHYSSYETALKKAVNEVGYHAREPRPEGFLSKKATAAYDSKIADLQSKATGWEKEIGWRDEAFKAASKARERQDADHVARAKASHDREHAPAAEKAEPLRARSAAHEREHARLRDKIERIFDKEKQRELAGKERSRGYGR